MIIAVIKGVHVDQDEAGVIAWESGAAVDADGANGQAGQPFAYRFPDDDGLDKLANAGYPYYGWRNVLLDNGSGYPLTDGAGNAYSQTTYSWVGRPLHHRFVDSCTVPYIVVNPAVRRHAVGVVIGCAANVTYMNNTVACVVADVSGPQDIGEISIAAARGLSIPDSPRTGGVNRGVSFKIYAGVAAVLGDVTYQLQPM